MNRFVKTLGIGFAIGIIVAMLNMMFYYFAGDWEIVRKHFVDIFTDSQIYSISLTFVNAYFFDYLNERKWDKYKKYRFLVGVIGSIVLTMTCIFILRLIEVMGVNGKSYAEFISNEASNGNFYLTSLLITVLISGIFHAVYFYRELQNKKVTEQKIIAGTASAKFDALKNQLDPHFLFNSLNVLTSLIEENPDAAQRFTTSLSKVYRYVLEQKSKELVTVDEELQFARTYVSLLKMRFEDSIVFDIPDKATNPEARVVPLSLQLLLENAVKHNVVNTAKPLRIKIFEKEGNLVVENNLQPKEVVKKSSGVGLFNIQQRYKLLTERQVQINKATSIFSVKIPMLTKRISVMKTQQNYIEDKRYLRAKERLKSVKEFYSNLIAYIIVIPILIFINYKSSDFPWAIFPALGWGFGVVAHWFEANGRSPFLGKGWEQRKIEELMQEEEQNSKQYR